ncbi:MAG: carbohydrate ABC transporter permease [Caldisericum sp.]|jgi:sn-glycerol 3-phosphate transport system permease protein|nr:carbohydrate ABC transporter permease [Caldisericum sp.]
MQNRKIFKYLKSWILNAITVILSLLWLSVIVWAIVVSFRPANKPLGLGDVWLNGFTFENYLHAWSLAPFGIYYRNTIIVVLIILLFQLVTTILAGFAFAHYKIVGGRWVLFFILLQLMIPSTALLVPNYATIRILGLFNTKIAIALPYLGSAFGTFLMRQAFLEIPDDSIEAGILDGCSWWQLLLNVYIPPSVPTIIALSISSITWHWNEFLWPFVVTNSDASRVLTVGLVRFTQLGEQGAQWPLLAAATITVAAPLLIAFLIFQRRFIASYLYSGIK